MAIFGVHDVIAVHDASKLYCMECIDLDRCEVVTIYTESDRIDEEILQFDKWNKII